jgi:hypothetical protein
MNLRVDATNFSRCFYGLGNGKDILVPFKTGAPMEKKRYLVYLYGRKNKSFGASNKTDQFS